MSETLHISVCDTSKDSKPRLCASCKLQLHGLLVVRQIKKRKTFFHAKCFAFTKKKMKLNKPFDVKTFVNFNELEDHYREHILALFEEEQREEQVKDQNRAEIVSQMKSEEALPITSEQWCNHSLKGNRYFSFAATDEEIVVRSGKNGTIFQSTTIPLPSKLDRDYFLKHSEKILQIFK